MPNVNYIGYKPNLEVIDAMQESNMFVYPSIWEETCCISAVEAMAAGNVAVVTNFGALFETCTDYAYYLNYESNIHTLAHKFKVMIEYLAKHLHEPELKERLSAQQKYYRHFYNWDRRAGEWESFFKQILKIKGVVA